MTKIISKYKCDDDYPITNSMKKTIWVIKYESEGTVKYICLCKELITVTKALPGMQEINSLNFS
ncbi:MAG: hypothetical protein IH950_03105 [Bacteroidetes bacterium]|nr:hypothetical protein [Bacteroidota bacterium]